MKNKNYHFSEYIDNTKDLFKLLFGEDMFSQINSVPLKTIEWEGIDVDSVDITAVTPDIKDRFGDEWIEYFKERDYTLFDLFLHSVFHYGYQQCYDVKRGELEALRENIEIFKAMRNNNSDNS